MGTLVDSYKIGKINVSISETDNRDKLLVECNDDSFRSEFQVSRYEYTYYKRHMNQRILKAFKEGHKEEK